MTTELINLGDYRKNISTLWKKSKEQNIKYLVMVHGKPAFEVIPVNDNKIDDDWTEYTPENHKAWIEGRAELERWETTQIDFDKINNYDDFISLIKQ